QKLVNELMVGFLLLAEVLTLAAVTSTAMIISAPKSRAVSTGTKLTTPPSIYFLPTCSGMRGAIKILGTLQDACTASPALPLLKTAFLSVCFSAATAAKLMGKSS